MLKLGDYLRSMNKMKVTRFKLGYSQSDIAHRLGVTQATYNRIENAVNRTSDEMLERIAEILKLSKDELYDQAEAALQFPPRLLSKAQMKRLKHAPLVGAHNHEAEWKEGVDPRDIPAVLKELKDLADAGVISETEFQKKKRDLLGRL